VHVVAGLEHHHRQPAVLADGPLGGGDVGVAHDLLERPAPGRRLLAPDRAAQGLEDGSSRATASRSTATSRSRTLISA
jgi:hypothetical protein